MVGKAFLAPRRPSRAHYVGRTMNDTSGGSARKQAIEVKGLYKSFGDQPALRGVDLVVPEGTTCVLMGVSGSGKTVLMKHIMGLLRPDRGVVLVEGQEVASLSEAALDQMRRQQGILFQANALFDSLNVFDNVAFPLRERTRMSEAEITETVNKTIARVGLSHATPALSGRAVRWHAEARGVRARHHPPASHPALRRPHRRAGSAHHGRRQRDHRHGQAAARGHLAGHHSRRGLRLRHGRPPRPHARGADRRVRAPPPRSGSPSTRR